MCYWGDGTSELVRLTRLSVCSTPSIPNLFSFSAQEIPERGEIMRFMGGPSPLQDQINVMKSPLSECRRIVKRFVIFLPVSGFVFNNWRLLYLYAAVVQYKDVIIHTASRKMLGPPTSQNNFKPPNPRKMWNEESWRKKIIVGWRLRVQRSSIVLIVSSSDERAGIFIFHIRWRTKKGR